MDNWLLPINYLAWSRWLSSNINLLDAFWKSLRISNLCIIFMIIKRSISIKFGIWSFCNSININSYCLHLWYTFRRVLNLLYCPPTVNNLMNIMWSKLLNKLFPVFLMIRVVNSSPKVRRNFSWLENINWHLVILALCWSMSQWIILRYSLILQFLVAYRLRKRCFKEYSIIASSDLSFRFEFVLIWLSPSVLVNLCAEWTSCGFSMGYSIRQ